jgi:hypothetical protein
MEVPNTKFHKNPSSGSRSDTCGQTDVTKLKDVFRNHANAPINHRHITWLCLRYNEYHVLLVCACSLSYPACKRMRSIILSSVTCLVLPHFSTLSHKRQDCRTKFIEGKMCIFIFSTNLSQTFIILRRIQRDIIINLHASSCKVPVILVRF